LGPSEYVPPEDGEKTGRRITSRIVTVMTSVAKQNLYLQCTCPMSLTSRLQESNANNLDKHPVCPRIWSIVLTAVLFSITAFILFPLEKLWFCFCFYPVFYMYLTASVVSWSELTTDPEVRVRFPALPDLLRNGGLERGPLSLVSTIEEVRERKSSGFGIENRDYGRRGSATLTTRHPSIRKCWR
jgi:hypothetical protein